MIIFSTEFQLIGANVPALAQRLSSINKCTKMWTQERGDIISATGNLKLNQVYIAHDFHIVINKCGIVIHKNLILVSRSSEQ